jgi:hypothetical protein
MLLASACRETGYRQQRRVQPTTMRSITELGSEFRHCKLAGLELDIRRRSLNLGVAVGRSLGKPHRNVQAFANAVERPKSD